MRGLIVIGCGAIAAACASNKPAREPARASSHPADSTTVTMQAAGSPDRSPAPDYGDPHAPSFGASRSANSQFSTVPDPGSPRPSALPTTAPRPAPDADNTLMDEKEKSGVALTPAVQGTSDVDLMITQQIRKAVVSDASLSFTAKNVKITTQGGKVTLRGDVKNEKERKAIEDSARKVAGPANVDNQLEVN